MHRVELNALQLMLRIVNFDGEVVFKLFFVDDLLGGLKIALLVAVVSMVSSEASGFILKFWGST